MASWRVWLGPTCASSSASRCAVLAGGTEAWRAAGLPLSSGAEHMAGAQDDVHLRPYDRPPEQVEQAMRDYLRWETALVPQLERDGTLAFPSFS